MGQFSAKTGPCLKLLSELKLICTSGLGPHAVGHNVLAYKLHSHNTSRCEGTTSAAPSKQAEMPVNQECRPLLPKQEPRQTVHANQRTVTCTRSMNLLKIITDHYLSRNRAALHSSGHKVNKESNTQELQAGLAPRLAVPCTQSTHPKWTTRASLLVAIHSS